MTFLYIFVKLDILTDALGAMETAPICITCVFSDLA